MKLRTNIGNVWMLLVTLMVLHETPEERINRLSDLRQAACERRNQFNADNFKKAINVYADLPCSICKKSVYPQQRVELQTTNSGSILPEELFSLGTTNGTIEFPNNVDYRKEWVKSKKVIKSFWKRWTREYLPTLTKRKPLKIDDIVIIVEDNAPIKSWKLGIVDRLI
ncbi:hypothetical protein JTB14_022997 [Gonioctena quinquepunctata]|nr:hypothetical protein JTB14_022997 [Gonioctena quinquepunctata]